MFSVCFSMYTTLATLSLHHPKANSEIWRFGILKLKFQKISQTRHSSHIQQKHSLPLHGALRRQSITKIQFKGRELPLVEKNYTDLDKVLSQLFRPLVKNDLLLFLVVFSSFKIIPSFQKIDYHLLEVPGKEWESERKIHFYTFPCTANNLITFFLSCIDLWGPSVQG